MSGYVFPDTAELTLPAVLFALSDPVRLEIVRQLAIWQEGELPLVCASVGPEMPKSTRSHHLKVLREAGVSYSMAVGGSVSCTCARRTWTRAGPGCSTRCWPT